MWFFVCASDKHCSSMLVWILHGNFSIRINMWGLFLALSWLTPQSCHRSNMNSEYRRWSWTLWTWQQFYVNFLPAAWQGVAQYSGVQCSAVQCTVINMRRGETDTRSHRPGIAGRKWCNVVSMFSSDHYIITLLIKSSHGNQSLQLFPMFNNYKLAIALN